MLRDADNIPIVDLKVLPQGSHNYASAVIQKLFMKVTLKCIWGKMDLIDFDKDQVNKVILDNMWLRGGHFIQQ